MTERKWSVVELVGQMRSRAEASGLAVIDLGQGAPVDETPAVVQEALAAASDWPGYPPAHGLPDLRAAYAHWAQRRWGATIDPQDVITTAGSKEFIATLPWLLGLGTQDVISIPELAYPTYAAGAAFAGCSVVLGMPAAGDPIPRLIWINSPGNPTGEVSEVGQLATVVDWAREHDALVVSDECYVELTPPGPPAPSVLSPEVTGGDYRNLLVVHSLSKRSNMAGYRVGFAAGDPQVVARVLQRRRDAGLIAAGPVQQAAAAALADDEHVVALQRSYANRRETLRAGLTAAGFRVDHSTAGLFVWATRGESDQRTAQQLADLGVLAAPGGFYGPSGEQHVRLSLTASEQQLAEVANRLSRLSR